MTAKKVVDKLVVNGIIPKEYKNVATCELHRELQRRSMRIVQVLASLVSLQQLGSRIIQDEVA